MLLTVEPFLQPHTGGFNAMGSSLVCLPDLGVCFIFSNESLRCSYIRVLSVEATVCGFSLVNDKRLPVNPEGICFY